MAVIKRPNQDALYLALNVYRDAMRSFIVNRLQSIPGISLPNSIADSLNPEQAEQFWKDLDNRDDVEEVIDVNIFGQIIQGNWKLAFTEIGDSPESIRGHFDAIREGRNLVAHPMNRDIPKPQAESILASMARILGKIGAHDESYSIDQIRDGMGQRPAPFPDTDKSGSLDPREIARLVGEEIAPIIKGAGENKYESADMTNQLRHDFNRLAQQVEDALEMLQPRPANSEAETTEQLRQELHSLGQQIIGAIENLRPLQHVNQARNAKAKPSRTAKSAAAHEPGNITDNWKAVAHHLNRTPGKKETSLGGLLRGARPVDIWINPDDAKLVLPFRSPVILDKIREELSHPEINEVIAESIALHFGRPLEIEPILLNQSG